MKKINYILFIPLFFNLLLGACSDDNETLYVSLNTREMTIHPKDDFQLFLKVQDGKRDFDSKAIWTVENEVPKIEGEAVITVDENGLVKANSNGTATVRATIDNGRYALAKINVVSRVSPEKGVSFAVSSHYMDIGGAIPDTLTLTVKTQLSQQFDILVKSSDENIVHPELIIPKDFDLKNASNTYKVALHRGGNEGVTTIYAQLGESKFPVEIHVGAKTYLSFNEISLAFGDPVLSPNSPYTLQINTEDTIKVHYLSIPDDKAHLDALKFRVRTEGDALLKITKCERDDQKGIYNVIVETGMLKGDIKVFVALDNHEVLADCTVMDKNDIQVESVVFDAAQKEITTHSKALSLRDNVKIMPLSAQAYWPVVWSVSDETLASINKEGSVVIKKAGTFQVIATSKDKSDQCIIHAQLAISSMTFVSGLLTELTETETTQWAVHLSANYETSNSIINWSSANQSVALVNSEGVITAVKAGKTTISATVIDDLGKTIHIEKELMVNAASSVNIYDLNFLPSEFHYYKDIASNGSLKGLSIQVYDVTGKKYYVFNLYKANETVLLTLKGTHTYTIGTELHAASTVEYVTENETATLLEGGQLIVNDGVLSFRMNAQKANKTIQIIGSNITSE